VGALLS